MSNDGLSKGKIRKWHEVFSSVVSCPRLCLTPISTLHSVFLNYDIFSMKSMLDQRYKIPLRAAGSREQGHNLALYIFIAFTPVLNDSVNHLSSACTCLQTSPLSVLRLSLCHMYLVFLTLFPQFFISIVFLWGSIHSFPTQLFFLTSMKSQSDFSTTKQGCYCMRAWTEQILSNIFFNTKNKISKTIICCGIQSFKGRTWGQNLISLNFSWCTLLWCLFFVI